MNEVFLASTAGGAIPFDQIDKCRIADGTPGPKTVCLHTEYGDRRAAGWYAEPVIYRQASKGVEKQIEVYRELIEKPHFFLDSKLRNIIFKK